MLSVSKIGQKALNKISNYNPNLIANLSKEAYELYLVRKQICEEIFPLVTASDMTIDKMKKILNDKLAETQNRMNKAKGSEEKRFLKLRIEELKDYL